MTRLPTLVDENAKITTPKDVQPQQAVSQQPVDQQKLPQDPTQKVTASMGDQTRADTRDPGTPQSLKQVVLLLDKLGLRRGADGNLVLNDQVSVEKLADPKHKSVAPRGKGAKLDTLPKLAPVAVTTKGVKPESLDAADSLTAAFLKVNIENPFDTVENRNKINQLASDMRQLLIENIKKELKALWDRMKEALASMSSSFFLVAIIAAIIIALIFSIIVAIIVMIIMMVVMQVVKGMIQKKIEAAKAAALREADRVQQEGERQIEAERVRQLEELANMSLIDENGDKITDEKLLERLQPKLVEALIKVTMILDQDGAAAAEDQGPQIIHDAMYDELMAMGIQVPEGLPEGEAPTQEELADQLAWAITAETMQNFADKVGRKEDEPVESDAPPPEEPDVGRNPGDVVPGAPPAAETTPAEQDTTIADEEPAIDEEPATGRSPDDLLGAMGGFTASLPVDDLLKLAEMADSPLIQQARQLVLEKVPPEVLSRITDSLVTKGIEATLREELLREPSIAPAATLGLSAVLHGSLGEEQAEAVLSGQTELSELTKILVDSKDRALEALTEVGGEGARAAQQLQHPTHF